MSKRALPDSGDSIAHGQESFKVALITPNVSVDFCAPELLASPWKSEILASGVLVPETSVNEHHGAPFRQRQVRPSSQVLSVQAKPETVPVQVTAHHNFGLRILRSDRGHHARADFCGYDIWHVNALQIRGFAFSGGQLIPPDLREMERLVASNGWPLRTVHAGADMPISKCVIAAVAD